MRHLKLAFRALARTPFVTGVAILSLALGIGANSAIFSLFNQMLLQPLPVQSPGELVNFASPGPRQGSTSCNQAGSCDEIFSYPMFRDLERVQTSFTGIAAHRLFSVNVGYQGQTENGQGVMVSGSYFPVLGITPTVGRLLGPDDDRTPGGHFVTVLGHEYWRRRFNEDPSIVNQTIIVNGRAMTVVGIAPAGFHGTTLGRRPNLFVPITMRELMQRSFLPTASIFENRRNYWVYLFARLQPGVSLEQAQVAINAPYRAILNDVDARLQLGMSEQTLARFKAKEVLLAPGQRGQSNMHREARAPLIVLLAVTGTVLLIACANIANLLLVRGAGRSAEMAVRLSIGANRRQLVTQLLIESCLLATLGAVLGLLVARWTLDLIRSIIPPEGAELVTFSMDPVMLMFAAALAVGTGLLFGLFPALHSTRPDLAATLKNQAGQPGGARGARRFRTSLATAQIALSMALLVPAGLFAKSLLNISRVDLGLKPDHLVAFSVSPTLNGYETDRTRALFERLEAELAGIPGVTSAVFSMVPVLAGDNWNNSLKIEGFDAGPDTDVSAAFNSVGPGFLRTMGIPLMAGREFADADALGAPKVAIVNQAFTRKFNLPANAVGRRIGVGGAPDTKLDVEIVGISQDAKYSDVKREVPAQYFVPYRQEERLGFGVFYVRTSLDPEQVLTAIPAVMKRLDENLPVEDLKTMEMQVRENVSMDRLISTLSTGFALLATLLAAIGLYGVLAYTVAQRTREIGLRMALGADAGNVRGMILRQVGKMAIVGGIIGLVTALGVGRLAQSLLFEMQGHDPIVMALSTIALAVVALGAGLLPAFRASRIDPMKALRYE
jgi:predicted permease